MCMIMNMYDNVYDNDLGVIIKMYFAVFLWRIIHSKIYKQCVLL